MYYYYLKNMKKNRHWFTMMGHTRLIAIPGIIISVLILVLIPSFKWLSGLVIGIVLIHVAMLLLLSISTFVVLPEKLKRKIRSIIMKSKTDHSFDYGWSLSWLNGYWIIGTILLAFSIFIYLYFSDFQLLAFALFLLSINLYLGSATIRASKNTNFLTLPYVKFFPDNAEKILDAGCGAGRTTISLSRIYKGNIVALDTFDSDYIEGGGNTLLEKNIKIAGIENRVKVVQGNITNTSFNDNHFDAVISTFMIDHLGNQKLQCLKEINRILKPGGRLLMIVIVPNLTAFAIANVFSFFLSSKKEWKAYFKKSNFKLVEEADINGAAYFLVEK
jgi:ubiquinone/menaquinone biosynthesis C-methylase UbiE